MGRIHKIEEVRGDGNTNMDFMPLERGKGITNTLPIGDRFLLKMASFSMEFAEYRQVPASLQQQLIAETPNSKKA